MRKILTTMLVALCVLTSAAADSTAVAHRLEVSLRGAWVLPSSPIVRGDNFYGAATRSAVSGAVEYAFSFSPSSRYGRLYPHAYQGIGLSAIGFSSSKVTGNPINLYVLQGSRIASLSERLSLDYEWNFGISAGWKKDDEGHPADYTMTTGLGSVVNAYIDLGLKLDYALNGHFSIVGGINLSHFSNGNTDYPNPGVNVLWGKVGLVYRPGNAFAVRHRHADDYTQHVSYDLTVYGAWRKNLFDSNYNYDGEPDINLIPGHFGVFGLNINPLWHFNPMFSAGASLDFQYDEGANLSPYYVDSTPTSDPRFYRQPFSHRMMAGVSVRAEMQMPIFSVNIGIGHSVCAPGGRDLRGWYQTFTLKTFVTRHLYLSTGYRLERFRNPGNLMLGAGYRFNAW